MEYQGGLDGQEDGSIALSLLPLLLNEEDGHTKWCVIRERCCTFINSSPVKGHCRVCVLISTCYGYASRYSTMAA